MHVCAVQGRLTNRGLSSDQLHLVDCDPRPSLSPAMSLAKLTSISTQTLSLLLERQRLESLPQFQSQSGSTGSSTSNLHLPQITRNLNQLRKGILELEANDPNRGGDAAGLLRNQHGRMRGMLGADAESLGIHRCVGAALQKGT